MALVNGSANRRNWPEPNCRRRRESASQLRVSVRLCGAFAADGKRCTAVVQRSKLTPEFYTKRNPRKGFTPVLGDWIKGLVLNFSVNLWCKPNIKWPNVLAILRCPRPLQKVLNQRSACCLSVCPSDCLSLRPSVHLSAASFPTLLLVAQ